MLAPHQQRVVDEKAELDEKAHKLSQFIGNSPIFLEIDPEEQERLKVQNDIMWQYSEILGSRISAFDPGGTCTVPRDRQGSETVTISLNEYQSLKNQADELLALQSAGVDNWHGYSDAMQILAEMTGSTEE